MTLVSHAQNFEDVMLWRALGHVERGRYLDIGAQDPMVDSVSKAFYDRGWRGWHVEPAAPYAEALRRARPDENVLAAAIGDGGSLRLHEFPETGLSTLQEDIALRHVRNGFERIERSVPVVPLAAVLADMARDGDIHWMKIDVEGAERTVLESWGDSPVRPWVLVIESTLPLSRELSHEGWEPLVLEKGYHYAYFDGLNRFYVAQAHRELLDAFASPPNVFDDFALSGTGSQPFCRHLLDQIQSHADQARDARARLDAGMAALEGMQEAVHEQRVRAEGAEQKGKELLAENERLRGETENARLRGEQLLAEVTSRLHEVIDQRMAAALEMFAHWQSAAHEAEAHTARLRAELDASQGNAHHWFVRANDLERQMAMLMSSTSWRITAPMRAVKRLGLACKRAGWSIAYNALRWLARMLRPLLRKIAQWRWLRHGVVEVAGKDSAFTRHARLFLFGAAAVEPALSHATEMSLSTPMGRQSMRAYQRIQSAIKARQS